MPKNTKDRPLMLRRKQDGLYLDSDSWPERHEFSTDWLLRSGVATVSDDTITLELKNAKAVYKIVESEDIVTTGFWGELEEGSVNG